MGTEIRRKAGWSRMNFLTTMNYPHMASYRSHTELILTFTSNIQYQFIVYRYEVLQINSNYTFVKYSEKADSPQPLMELNLILINLGLLPYGLYILFLVLCLPNNWKS